jgi:DNA-directed RNA polymerase specialized sigma24 family protein
MGPIKGSIEKFVTTRRALEPNHLDSLLRQLSPDREQAGMEYEQLRRRLITMFTFRHCAEPESLADETLDRVARKIAESPGWGAEIPSRTGRVFGVAWNVARESFREHRPMALPEQWDPADPSSRLEDAENVERAERCLDACLTQLPPQERDLVLAYYREQRSARITLRSALASSLGLTPSGLRVKVHRLTGGLRSCIAACTNRPSRPPLASTSR